jgi:hypothetical protein
MGGMGRVKPVTFYLYGECVGQDFIDESDVHAGSCHTLEGVQYRVIKKSNENDGLRVDVELTKATFTNLVKKPKTKHQKKRG